jgi:hypothetical protein
LGSIFATDSYDKQAAGVSVTANFKGARYPKSVVLQVFFHVRYALSYRDLKEILAARGVDVDHTILSTAGLENARPRSPPMRCANSAGL